MKRVIFGIKVSGGNVVHTKCVFRHGWKFLQPIKADMTTERISDTKGDSLCDVYAFWLSTEI